MLDLVKANDPNKASRLPRVIQTRKEVFTASVIGVFVLSLPSSESLYETRIPDVFSGSPLKLSTS